MVKLKSVMKNHNPSGEKTAGTAPPSRWRRHRFRRKVPSEVIVKGQLRMRSPSGAFVIVGVTVVLVGMTIAVIGYWPHRTRAGSNRWVNTNTTDEIKKEVKVSPHPIPHSEKLKLVGPVIMGIGLFIFICANTMLYENRDMETRLLMQRELYSMSLVVPPDRNRAGGYFQRRHTQPALQNAGGVEGCYEVDLLPSGFPSCSCPVKKWGNGCNSNTLQTTTQFLHHKSISPSLSLLSVRSDAPSSVPGNLALAHGTEPVTSTAANALSLPLIKLNNCLLESQGFSQGVVWESHRVRLPEEKEEVLRLSWTLLPGSGNLAPGRDESKDNSVRIDMDVESPSTSSVETLLHPVCVRREFSSASEISNSGHSKSLDLGQPGSAIVGPIKERKHRSWPRLDRIGFPNYSKLESNGESSDRLLELTRDPLRDNNRQSSREVIIEAGSAF